MTEKRCKDCKYIKGIGYDFWCGEGHTEYEVFGGKTDCPYYEYHDWSKGIPNKTEKRFIVPDCSTCVFDKITKEEYVCIDREEAFLVCNKFNKLVDEYMELKKNMDRLYNYKMNKKIICNGKDIIEKIEELQDD